MFSKIRIDDKGNLEMKTIKKGPSEKHKTIVLLIFMLLILLCYNSVHNGRNRSVKECIYLNTGWDFTINDKTITEVDISKFTFDLVNIGDEITMERTLPKKKIAHPVLIFYQYHCTVDVFVDDKLIYQTGYVEKENNESVGFGIYTVSLPEDYMGKKLRINLHVNGMNSFNSIEVVRIENEDDYIYYMLKDNLVIVITTSLMIVIGMIILFFMLSIGKFEQQHRRIMEIGFLSLVSGLWSFSNYGLSKLVMDNLEVIMCLEYIMGYAIFLAAYLIFMDAEYPRKLQVAARTLAVLYAGYLLSMLITELTNTIHTFEYMNF
ncbi:MAG: hypothetical protein K6G26_00140, partial [Lachnospiraceae bacterium]|nr:hypothetical protein [Lachnospiraceae bacterium]